MADTRAFAESGTELELMLGDVKFWIAQVERLGYDEAVYGFNGNPTLDQLSRHFDSSQRGLLRIFHLFDKDHDSVVTFEEIARGLRQQALFMHTTADAHAAYMELCVLMDPQKTGLIRPPEFLRTLKSLRMAALLHRYMRRPAAPFKSSTDEAATEIEDDMVIHSHEYKEDKILARTPIEAPVSFLFSQLPALPSSDGMKVRWLHAHDADKRTVLGLAMKFGIDPRFIFDILYLWREQARADRVDAATVSLSGAESLMRPTAGEAHQLFILVPVLRLTPRSEASCRPYEAWRRLKRSGLGRHAAPPLVIAEVEHCNLAMVVVGEGVNATVLSFTSDWGRLSKLMTDDVAPVTEISRELAAAEAAEDGEAKALSKKWSRINSEAMEMLEVHDSLAAFSKILTTLNTSYSHLRTGDCHTLVLKSLCEITEDYLAVTKAYEYGLNVLQKRLDRQRDNMSNKDVRRIRKSIRQLSHLYRLVSPVLAVADVLGNMKWSGDAQLYLSDIRGNITRFLDDAIANREFARGMIDQFQNFCESKTSQILYLLTRITTIFVPGQFLASVYGMNFVDEDGNPTIPELTWKYGYAYYWALNITVTTGVLTVIFYITRRS